jgi:hypothetical protein
MARCMYVSDLSRESTGYRYEENRSKLLTSTSADDSLWLGNHKIDPDRPNTGGYSVSQSYQ